MDFGSVRGEMGQMGLAVRKKRFQVDSRCIAHGLELVLGACGAERFWAPSDTMSSGNE